MWGGGTTSINNSNLLTFPYLLRWRFLVNPFLFLISPLNLKLMHISWHSYFRSQFFSFTWPDVIFPEFHWFNLTLKRFVISFKEKEKLNATRLKIHASPKKGKQKSRAHTTLAWSVNFQNSWFQWYCYKKPYNTKSWTIKRIFRICNSRFILESNEMVTKNVERDPCKIMHTIIILFLSFFSLLIFQKIFSIKKSCFFL